MAKLHWRCLQMPPACLLLPPEEKRFSFSCAFHTSDIIGSSWSGALLARGPRNSGLLFMEESISMDGNAACSRQFAPFTQSLAHADSSMPVSYFCLFATCSWTNMCCIHLFPEFGKTHSPISSCTHPFLNGGHLSFSSL